MSGGDRNWATAFATIPAPPPLAPKKSHEQEAADDADDAAAPAPAPARVEPRHLATVVTPETGREPETALPEPAELSSQPGSVAPARDPLAQPAAPEPAAGRSALAGATRAERSRGTALLAALSDAGIDAVLIGVRRGTSGPSFDVEVASDEAIERLVVQAEDLAGSLGVTEVRVARRAGEGMVRLDVIEEAGPGAGRSSGRQTAVWVPAVLRKAVADVCERTDQTATDFFLGAFNRQYAKLESLFPQRLPSQGPMPMKATRKRRSVDTAVQMWLYMDPEQREILDDAVQRTGAGSRSALATRILSEDLGIPESS